MLRIPHLLTGIVTMLAALQLFGQAPQGITYQAVARNLNGNVLPDSALTARMSVLLGDVSGDLLWEETHAVSTNPFGLFTLVIGQGDNTGNGLLPAFSDIDWSTGTFYLQVEIDPEGFGLYDLMGVSQFLTVPFAFYADNAGAIQGEEEFDPDSTNECITAAELVGNTLAISQCEVTWEVPLDELVDDGDWTESDDNTNIHNTTHLVGIGTDAPASTLQVLGSFSVPITEITGPSTVVLDPNTHTFVFDLSDGDVQATLPSAASCYGRMYVIKLFSSGAVNNLNLVTWATETVDGQDDPSLPATSNLNFTIQSDGDEWWVVQGSIAP